MTDGGPLLQSGQNSGSRSSGISATPVRRSQIGGSHVVIREVGSPIFSSCRAYAVGQAVD